MNDRWLFLAAFCLLIMGCGVVIYWLVRQLQVVIADHKELREAHHEALAQIIEKQNETALKLGHLLLRRPRYQEADHPQDTRQGRSLSARCSSERKRRRARVQPASGARVLESG
jgi:hypothetical protein